MISCWSHGNIEHILLQQTEEKLLMKTDFIYDYTLGEGCQLLSLSASAQMLILSDCGSEVGFFFPFVFLVPHGFECNGPREMGIIKHNLHRKHTHTHTYTHRHYALYGISMITS